ncbi:hypothetical protein [Breoghania sp.]|uniref:hypothetical protein n=1 Tax=Breoghania sp. TaxID=2065378 RepID=UPI0026102B23|nr:hypothetical protein [Breoghania sp.]MDJ0930068.1 hypothetical protein [Breoghania sp.]
MRIVLSVVGEIAFSMLLAPVMAITHTVFIGKLVLGKGGTWAAQRRGLHAVPWMSAVRRLWPQTPFGGAGVAWFSVFASPVLIPALPIILGPLIAILFARLKASMFLGRLALASGLWRIPEEASPSADLCSLGLPALPSLAETSVPGLIFEDAPTAAE